MTTVRASGRQLMADLVQLDDADLVELDDVVRHVRLGLKAIAARIGELPADPTGTIDAPRPAVAVDDVLDLVDPDRGR